LPVEGFDGCRHGKAGCEGGGPELCCTAAGGKDGADGNVFDKGGVDAGAFNQGLKGTMEEVGSSGVFETAFATLCDGGAEGAGNDDLESWSSVTV
jgi:hypothetical protein